MKNTALELELAVIAEGVLYFVLLRFLLIGSISQLLRKITFLAQGFLIPSVYYLLIVIISLAIGRRIAEKSVHNRILNSIIAVTLYSVISLIAFIWPVNSYEFIFATLLNYSACIAGTLMHRLRS